MSQVLETQRLRVDRLFSDVTLAIARPTTEATTDSPVGFHRGRVFVQLPLFSLNEPHIFTYAGRTPVSYIPPDPVREAAVAAKESASRQMVLPTFYPDGRYFVRHRPFRLEYRRAPVHVARPTYQTIISSDPPPSVVRLAGRLAGVLADGSHYIPREKRRLMRVGMARRWIFHAVNPVSRRLDLRLAMRKDKNVRVYPLGSLRVLDWKRLMGEFRARGYRPVPNITYDALHLFHGVYPVVSSHGG